jgi:hypothetical protein
MPLPLIENGFVYHSKKKKVNDAVRSTILYYNKISKFGGKQSLDTVLHCSKVRQYLI